MQRKVAEMLDAARRGAMEEVEAARREVETTPPTSTPAPTPTSTPMPPTPTSARVIPMEDYYTPTPTAAFMLPESGGEIIEDKGEIIEDKNEALN